MTIHQLHPHGAPIPQSWDDRLRACRTEHDVVATAKDYLAQFSPAEIASLPEECRPYRLVDGRDVSDYALCLVRRECDGQDAGALLHRMGAFFSHATSRLAEILHRISAREGDSERSA